MCIFVFICINERLDIHPALKRNLLRMKEADLWPDFRKILLENLVAGVSALTSGY